MSDYTNTPIGSGYNANSAINTELSAVETAVNSKLDKSGSTMTGELDMNSKKIINLPDAATLQEPVTYGQMINGASFAASDAKFYDTVALWQADTTSEVGDIAIIGERGNGTFNVISGTGTANTYNIVAHTTLDLSVEAYISTSVSDELYGVSATASASYNQGAAQAALSEGLTTYFRIASTIDSALTSSAAKQSIIFQGGSLTADAGFTDDYMVLMNHVGVKILYADIDGNNVAGELAGVKAQQTGCSVMFSNLSNCTGSGIVKSGAAEYFRDIGNHFLNCYNDVTDSTGANNHRADYSVVALGLYEDTVNTTISTNNVSNTVFALNTGAGKAGSEATSGGILLEASTGSDSNIIIGNTFSDMGVEAYQVAGITTGTVIVGNACNNTDEGFKIFGTGVEGTVLVGNVATHDSNGDDQIAAIDLNSSVETVVGMNYTNGFKRGIRTLNTTGLPQDIIAMGNMIKGNSNKAIYEYAENMVVTCNLVIGDGVASDGIAINALGNTSDTCLTAMNLIRDCAGTGIEGFYNSELRFLTAMNMLRNNGTDVDTTGRTNIVQFRNILDTETISGELTLNGTTAVTVTTDQIANDAKLNFYPKTPTGTEGAIYCSKITSGVEFDVKSTNASDTSVIQWVIDK